MLPHPTLDQLRALRLDGMAQAFASLKRKRRPAISRTPNGWHSCSIAKLATRTCRNGRTAPGATARSGLDKDLTVALDP